MQPICIHSREPIERYLRQNPSLHLYEIGDLDDFFWRYTTWYALPDETGALSQLVLVYTGTSLPIMLALTHDPSQTEGMRALLSGILPFLPRRLYSHLSDGLKDLVATQYRLDSHGLHYKMDLVHPEKLAAINVDGVEQLLPSNREEISAFFEASYPGNWFDARMLETGQYFGARRDGSLASVAGIHVYSPEYGVAALGNITTHPAYRGQGLATAVTARLCQSLRHSVTHIGLNVKANNTVAIATYRKIGFEVVSQMEEIMLEPT